MEGGIEFDGGMEGDYGGDFGGDSGSSFGGDWGADYAGDYGGDWGGDYGGNSGWDYEDNFGTDYAPENFPADWDTNSHYGANSSDSVLEELPAEEFSYDNLNLNESSIPTDLSSNSDSMEPSSPTDDYIVDNSEEFVTPESDMTMVGTDENAPEEISIPEFSTPDSQNADVPVESLDSDFGRTTDISLNDAQIVDDTDAMILDGSDAMIVNEPDEVNTIMETEAVLENPPDFYLGEDDEATPIATVSEDSINSPLVDTFDMDSETPPEILSEAGMPFESISESEEIQPQEGLGVGVIDLPEEEIEMPEPAALEEELQVDSQYDQNIIEAPSNANTQDIKTSIDIETFPADEVEAQPELVAEEKLPKQVEELELVTSLEEHAEEIAEQIEVEQSETDLPLEEQAVDTAEQQGNAEDLDSDQEMGGDQIEENQEEILQEEKTVDVSKDAELTLEDLEPNTTYSKNGYTYQIDDQGRPELISGDLKLEDGTRSPQQTEIGNLGEEDDQGGHMIGTRFDGPPDAFNIVPQNANLNQGEWKAMENEWADAIKDDSQVKVEIQPVYDGDGIRPEAFGVSYTIDGVRTDKFFENASSKA